MYREIFYLFYNCQDDRGPCFPRSAHRIRPHLAQFGQRAPAEALMSDETMKHRIIDSNPPGSWNDQIARAVAWRMAMPGATPFDLVHTSAGA